MSDKTKKTTSGKLWVRGGGFALTLPLVIFMLVMLLMVNIMMIPILLGSLFNEGGIYDVIAPYIPIIAVTLLVSIATMIGLMYAVVRYMGGMRQLYRRSRGIQQEQARIDRLVEQQIAHDETDNLIVEENHSQRKNQGSD